MTTSKYVNWVLSPLCPPRATLVSQRCFTMGRLFSEKKFFWSGLLSTAQQWEVLVQGEKRAHEVVCKQSHHCLSFCPIKCALTVCIYTILLSTNCHGREVDRFQPLTKTELFLYNAMSFSWITKSVKHVNGR